jgi:hypothetical protein
MPKEKKKGKCGSNKERRRQQKIKLRQLLEKLLRQLQLRGPSQQLQAATTPPTANQAGKGAAG